MKSITISGFIKSVITLHGLSIAVVLDTDQSFDLCKNAGIHLNPIYGTYFIYMRVMEFTNVVSIDGETLNLKENQKGLFQLVILNDEVYLKHAVLT